jgi:hypothetical protein
MLLNYPRNQGKVCWWLIIALIIGVCSKLKKQSIKLDWVKNLLEDCWLYVMFLSTWNYKILYTNSSIIWHSFQCYSWLKCSNFSQSLTLIPGYHDKKYGLNKLLLHCPRNQGKLCCGLIITFIIVESSELKNNQ